MYTDTSRPIVLGGDVSESSWVMYPLTGGDRSTYPKVIATDVVFAESETDTGFGNNIVALCKQAREGVSLKTGKDVFPLEFDGHARYGCFVQKDDDAPGRSYYVIGSCDTLYLWDNGRVFARRPRILKTGTTVEQRFGLGFSKGPNSYYLPMGVLLGAA